MYEQKYSVASCSYSKIERHTHTHTQTILTQQATTKQQRTVVPNAFVRASILNHFVLFCLILCFLNDFMVAVVVFVLQAIAVIRCVRMVCVCVCVCVCCSILEY